MKEAVSLKETASFTLLYGCRSNLFTLTGGITTQNRKTSNHHQHEMLYW